MKILILDDDALRHASYDATYSGHDVVHAYTYSSFIQSLPMSPWDVVHLDHDLGDLVPAADTYVDGWGSTQPYTGYHAAMQICELDDHLLPHRVIVQSVNPVGARRMVSTLQRRGVDATWEPFGETQDTVEE